MEELFCPECGETQDYILVKIISWRSIREQRSEKSLVTDDTGNTEPTHFCCTTCGHEWPIKEYDIWFF